MEIDLSSLSLKELRVLQANVERLIHNYEARRRKEALSELQEKARDLGFSLSELALLADSRKASADSIGLPKYINPENSHQTWTGRGRRPAWFTHALASGLHKDDLLIKSS